MRRTVTAVSFLAAVEAQKAGNLKQEKNPDLSLSECDQNGGCTSSARSVTIDSNWRWTHKNGKPENCYTGNLWDKSICDTPDNCWSNCEIEGADEEYEQTYGIRAKGDALNLTFVTQGPYSRNVGSRVYLLDSDKEKYQIFKLKNREFSFTVDASQLPCGLNGALYFVSMDADGGKTRYDKQQAGAKYGTGYCDAQCPHDLKWINGMPNAEDWIPQPTDKNSGWGHYGTCCTELDMWEANAVSKAFTMHSCNVTEQTRCEGVACGDNAGHVTPEGHRFDGVCDKNGCDYATARFGMESFYGAGGTVDSNKPVTVVTQFVTVDGTDAGDLKEVRQFYVQDGKKIETPSVKLQGNTYDSISEDMCKDWAATTKDGTNFIEKGGMKSVQTALEKGMVLVMSLWDDHDANMLWLDSNYPVDSKDPTMYRGKCDSKSGVAKDVEEKNGKSSVVFSDLKTGPIGSTTAGGGGGSCTAKDQDPYASGKHVACCSGLAEKLGQWDQTGRWYYHCVAGETMVV